MNKHMKTVMTPQRSSLRADRAVKAVFVYANLRFLNNVDSTEQKLLSFLVDASIETHDMSIDEVAKLEKDKSRALYLDHNSNALVPRDKTGIVTLDCPT